MIAISCIAVNTFARRKGKDTVCMLGQLTYKEQAHDKVCVYASMHYDFHTCPPWEKMCRPPYILVRFPR